MNRFYFFLCALGLLLSPSMAQSDADVFSYDKNDLSFYVTAGYDYRFVNTKDIQNVLLGTHWVPSPYDTAYTASKQPIYGVATSYTPNYTPFNSGSWGLFGENNVANMNGYHLETGAYLHRWQFGLSFSHALQVTSLRPSNMAVVNFPGLFTDTSLTTPVTATLDLYDASFNISDFDFMLGYRLLPNTQGLNLNLRAGLGLTLLTAHYPASYANSFSGLAAQTYYYEDRDYQSSTWNADFELVPSLRMGNIEFALGLGYRLDNFDLFQIIQDKNGQWYAGQHDGSLNNYYASFRISYIWPSFNEVKNSH